MKHIYRFGEIFYFPFYFVSLNIAGFMSFIRFVRKSPPMWEKKGNRIPDHSMPDHTMPDHSMSVTLMNKSNTLNKSNKLENRDNYLVSNIEKKVYSVSVKE